MSRRKPWFHAKRNTWYVTVDGKQVNLYTSEKKEAYEAWHRLAADKPKGTPHAGASQSRTAIEIIGLFLADLERNAAPSTLNWYAYYLKAFLKSIPSYVPAEDLKIFHVDEWLSKQSWQSPSRRAAIIAIKRAFNWAAEKEYIPTSPFQKLKKPPGRRRETILSDEQIQSLIEASTPEFADLIVVAIESGCRPQELRSLEASHFDPSIPGFVLEPNEHKTGKETQRRRVIYLTDKAMAIVKPLMEQRPKGPLFRNHYGRPWKKDTIVRLMRRTRQKLDNVPKDLCFYNLRHTFATDALVAGLNPEELRVLLGHQNLTMIVAHYSHLAKHKSHMRDAVKRARRED